jgi:hypothetical protein
MRAVRNLITKLQETPPKEKEKIDNFHVTSSTGTEIFGGEFFEEYLQEIRGNEWAKIADRMRRSSDQVNMLLTLIKTPIINATWEIESPDESEISNEIKEFLEFALFDNIDFEQFIQEALTFYEFGHSVFEVVYTPLINHAKHSNTIIPKKFSFISPKTIEEWRLNNDGSINHIRQMVDGDLSRDVRIEADNLMVMSINKEGSNYEGRSLLRPIYGNWKRKQNFLKILAIGIERSSLGVPVGITAQSAGSKARDTLQKILNAVTTHQRSSIVVPHGTDVKNFSISFDAEKVEKVIEAERRGMSQSFLAGFMELGTNSGGTGSYALSSNLSNIFFSSLDTPANIIAKKLNGIIKDLIDFNYGKQELYHKIRVSNISDKLGKEFVENLTMLTQSGYVSATDTMKEYLRKKFNLPESDLEEEENILETEIDLIEENNTNFTNKEKRSNILDFAQSTSASKLITSQKEELQELMITELTKRRDKLLENTRVILNNNKTQNRRKEVVNQSIPGSRQYKKDILNFLVELSATATKQVLSEIKLPKAEFADKKDLETLTPNTKKRLETEIDLIVKTQESDLEKNTYFAFNNNVDNTDSTEALLQQMKEGSDTYINGPSIEVGAANFTSNAVNNARNDVYQSKEILDEMESFTIVNPSPEAAICKELAGRTITKEQYINGDLPPYHHNCNTIVVANVKGAKGNPKINPLGLSFTGTEEQVEKIIKSNTL